LINRIEDGECDPEFRHALLREQIITAARYRPLAINALHGNAGLARKVAPQRVNSFIQSRWRAAETRIDGRRARWPAGVLLLGRMMGRTMLDRHRGLLCLTRRRQYRGTAHTAAQYNRRQCKREQRFSAAFNPHAAPASPLI